MAQTSRMPVLLTVPFSVMRPARSVMPPYPEPEMLRNVFSLSAGLDVFISAIGFSPYCRSGLWPRRGMVRETSIPVSILILPRAEIAGCAKRGNLLYAEFVVDGLGDGGGVVAHLGFAFGFDHDAGEGFGAGVADDYAAGILQVFFGGRMAAATAGMDSRGRFSRTSMLTMTWGKTFRSAVSSSMDLPVRAMRSRTTSAVSRPSPVVARWGRRMWPDCSPPRAALWRCICSRT